MLFHSCKPSELKQITQNTNINNNLEVEDIDKNDLSINVNQNAVNLISKINSNYICNCIPTDRRISAFKYNNSLYILSGISGTQETLHELNFQTGYLNSICRDPLCNHEALPCVERYYYTSYTTDGVNIYVLGEYPTKDNVGRMFIGVIDPEQGKLNIFHEWKPSLSANSLSFEYYEGCLYYTKATSDTTNAIYKYLLTVKKEELVSHQDEYIVVFAINNNVIYYRNNYSILKSLDIAFKTTNILNNDTSIMFPKENYLYYFDNVSNDNAEYTGYNLHRLKYEVPDYDEIIIENVYNPSATLYTNDRFYYTLYNYQENQKIYIYEVINKQTSSITINHGSRADVLAVIDNIMVLKLFTDFDINTGQRDIEYYLYSVETNNMVQIYCD